VKLATHIHLVPRSRMRGAIPPLSTTPSWRGAQLQHRDNLTVVQLMAHFMKGNLSELELFQAIASKRRTLRVKRFSTTPGQCRIH